MRLTSPTRLASQSCSATSCRMLNTASSPTVRTASLGPLHGSLNGAGIGCTTGRLAQLLNPVAPSSKHISRNRRRCSRRVHDFNRCSIALLPDYNRPFRVFLYSLKRLGIGLGFRNGLFSPHPVMRRHALKDQGNPRHSQHKHNLGNYDPLFHDTMSLTSLAVWMASLLRRVRSTRVAPAM